MQAGHSNTICLILPLPQRNALVSWCPTTLHELCVSDTDDDDNNNNNNNNDDNELVAATAAEGRPERAKTSAPAQYLNNKNRPMYTKRVQSSL